MPTGYTAAIKDGITFREYAWGCARAFGALIEMRDDPADAEIPERFEPSTYHPERLAEAEVELSRLLGLSEYEVTREADASYAEALTYFEKRNAAKADLRAKYEAMLAQAEAYEPPTSEHIEYKEFMVSQIRGSIDFDCGGAWPEKPERETAAAWLDKALSKARWNVRYHEEEGRKELERTESRNRWLTALRESLAPTELEQTLAASIEQVRADARPSGCEQKAKGE